MKAKSSDTSILHVQIDNPTDVRRNILESAINSAEILKNYEKYREIRHRKKQYMERFAKISKEIKEEINKLEDNLPEIKEEVKKPEIPRVTEQKPVVKVKKVVHKEPIIKQQPKSKLEQDIDEIRKKLARL